MKKILNRLGWLYSGGFVATFAYTLTMVLNATTTLDAVFAGVIAFFIALSWPVSLTYAWFQLLGVTL